MFEQIGSIDLWQWLVLWSLWGLGAMLHRIGKVLQHVAQNHTDLHMNELLQIRRTREGRD